MSNPFFYLGGLLLVASYPLGGEPLAFVDKGLAPWAVVFSLAIYGGICWPVLNRPLDRPGLARFLLQLAALALYSKLVFVFHLPLWIWELGVEEDPMASTLLSLLPLFLLFGVLALVTDRTHPQSGGLRFAFRSFVGLSLLPILIMLGLEEAFQRIGPLRRMAFVYPAAGWMVALGSLTLLMIFLPPLLRGILAARPLPASALRDRLERLCSLAGFPGAQLLVVPTGTSRLANAFVVGLSTRWRYVFFTPAILDGMSPEELDCVLVHEVTHSRKRHLLLYLVGALTFSLLSGLGYEALVVVGAPSALLYSAFAAWVLLYWGLGFGYVSRRFETEADLTAARVVPAPEGVPPFAAARRMAGALERVAWLNHVPLSAPGWRHFSLERRIDILLRSEADPSIGARFERVCDRLRLGAAVLLLAALAGGGLLLRIQQGRAPANLELYRAYEAAVRGDQAFDAKRYEEARAELKRGIDAGWDGPEVWVRLADAERALGREEAARAAEAEARRKDPSDPRLRLRLRTP